MSRCSQEVEARLLLDLSKELPKAKILRLSATKNIDHDGDPYLRIRVVLESEEGVEPSETLKLARRLQDKLELYADGLLPIFEFVLESDLLDETA